MKKMRNILLLALAAVLVMGMLAGCESMEEKVAKLAGTWIKEMEDTEEQAKAALENVDMYEEEIALIDLTSLKYSQVVTFGTDLTYSFACDAEGTKACVREFFIGAVDALYEGRESLEEVYEQELSDMSKDAFQAFYAEQYSMDDFDALLDAFVDATYDYETLAEPWETGTYTIRGSDIMCTITGTTEAEALGYEITGDVLVLTYSDAVEAYGRVS